MTPARPGPPSPGDRVAASPGGVAVGLHAIAPGTDALVVASVGMTAANAHRVRHGVRVARSLRRFALERPR